MLIFNEISTFSVCICLCVPCPVNPPKMVAVLDITYLLRQSSHERYERTELLEIKAYERQATSSYNLFSYNSVKFLACASGYETLDGIHRIAYITYIISHRVKIIRCNRKLGSFYTCRLRSFMRRHKAGYLPLHILLHTEEMNDESMLWACLCAQSKLKFSNIKKEK